MKGFCVLSGLREACFLPDNEKITIKHELGRFLFVTWLSGRLFTLFNVVEKVQSVSLDPFLRCEKSWALPLM